MTGIYDIAKLADFVVEFKLLNELLSDNKKLRAFVEGSAEIKQTLELRNTLQAEKNQLAQDKADTAKLLKEAEAKLADADSRIAVADKKEIDYAAKKSVFDSEKRDFNKAVKKYNDDFAKLEEREARIVEIELKTNNMASANSAKQAELDGLITQYKALIEKFSQIAA